MFQGKVVHMGIMYDLGYKMEGLAYQKKGHTFKDYSCM